MLSPVSIVYNRVEERERWDREKRRPRKRKREEDEPHPREESRGDHIDIKA